ncbi:Glutamyl-tRNA(Gln) amidotransferase subunit B, mitochondrial [Habropoda laboriosa]|uniref:Glutamyl-tRNA(Gln) amidotransferase subunit B, mitochondrial n=1 Tax=Habropoda laboriosa TaxID=597456 RepID=A0A0L7QY22_9HYME|nr:Glutamyl-tRNA(Gln) amidotransferase subunit B, mitochondrial [Habropoda laboriosa]
MPVLNKKCVEAGVFTALALSCEVNAVSMFERKHYFYSDLPAGFQITQQKKPLAVNGRIKFNVFKQGVHKEPYSKSSKVKQIQLEQDSGRSMHNEDLGRSFIDLNRAGIPLMELVFEPDLTSGEEAAALVKELCFILQLLGTCSCKMEEGALRVDANVSISKPDAPLGIRTELKNIGSIAAINNAINYEIKRQISILERGGQVINETRAWNALSKKTIIMREKEDKHDYRFMPEPNLPPLCLYVNRNVENKYNLIDVQSIKKQLPKLPEQIRETLQNRKIFKESKIGIVNNKEYIEELVDLMQANVINQLTLRRLLNELINEPNKMPKQIVEENNWFMISNEKELEILCLKILEKNPGLVKKYKKGHKKVFKKFLHETIIISDRRADMSQVIKIMTRLLS